MKRLLQSLRNPHRQKSQAHVSGASEPCDTSRRILVLGSAPHTRLVWAYTWDRVPADLNVADYDVVILNLVPFLDEQLVRQIDVDTLPSWEPFARLLFSKDSEIISIGVPGAHISGTRRSERSQPPSRATTAVEVPLLHGVGIPYREIPWWLPATPVCTIASGEEIRNIEDEFAYYFRYVHHWRFYATAQYKPWSRDMSYYLNLVHPQANDLRLSLRPIAQTRFQQPIAFEMRYQAVHAEEPGYLASWGREGQTAQVVAESGRAIWLPPPTAISAYEAVDLILRERYGLQFEQAPPDWVETYKLPSQLPIEEDIARYEIESQQLTEKLTAARHRLREATRFRKLLYEQGEDALEPVVRDAFRELGASVFDPQARGREDGRLTDPSGRNCILEIKGRTHSLKQADVRELDQWVRDAVVGENLHSKGILVANTYCADPPMQRKEPYPDNCIRAAEQLGICLITTTQLFGALRRHQKGELDLAQFWNTIFDAEGACSLSELADEFTDITQSNT
jgi:hypothetical protein